MTKHLRRDGVHDDSGFSLVELLIVVIIMGLLAAIAIPLFVHQTKRAEDSKAFSDVELLAHEINSWYVNEEDDPVITVLGTDPSRMYHIAATTVTAPGTEDTAVGPASPGVDAPVLVANSKSDWCVSVTNPRGRFGSWRAGATFTVGPGTCS
ncbi:MAG: type II secretion system GspH family protein [Bifidobacteriaceae bacterium]|jgi:prepilin-type N-terminal cleavage/methylation domain-containing protein|nr:type II secretion system GspH family protein [Bifidobacteriaceae bacterium]